MHINNGINVATAIIQQAGIILILARTEDILMIGYWIAVSNVFGLAGYVYFVSRSLSPSVLLPRFSMQLFMRVKEYLSQMAGVSVLAMALKQLDKLLLSMFLPIGVLGIYSFAYLTVTKLGFIAESVMQALFPAISELHQKDGGVQSKEQFFFIQDILTFGLMPVYASVLFFALPLFNFLLDDTQARSLLVPLLLLSAAFYINGLLKLFNTYVSAIGKPGYILRSILIALIVAGLVAPYLIQEFGISGAAFLWLVISLTGAAYIVPLVCRREFKCPIRPWIVPVVHACLVASMTYLPAWLVANRFSNVNIVYYITLYLLATLIYLVLALNLSSKGFQRSLLILIPWTSILVQKKWKAA
jgi:O-antigen/teichoic acid export membrane protein